MALRRQALRAVGPTLVCTRTAAENTMFAKPLCAADPFDLLLTPDAVLQAMERSEHLSRLRRRICRPLDVRGEHDGEGKPSNAAAEPRAARDSSWAPVGM
jgi:hypothetical protein